MPESAASSKQVARQAAAARSKPTKPGKKPARLPPEFKDLSSWCVRAARSSSCANVPVLMSSAVGLLVSSGQHVVSFATTVQELLPAAGRELCHV